VLIASEQHVTDATSGLGLGRQADLSRQLTRDGAVVVKVTYQSAILVSATHDHARCYENTMLASGGRFIDQINDFQHPVPTELVRTEVTKSMYRRVTACGTAGDENRKVVFGRSQKSNLPSSKRCSEYER